MKDTPPPHTPADHRAVVGAVPCRDYKRTSVETALTRALDPLGGISTVVKPGQTVLLNPNLLSPRPPEKAVTTHPQVVAAVVRQCLEAGARTVWVGDSPAGNHDENRLWEKTGMLEAVQNAGGIMKSFRGPVTPTPCGNRKIPALQWLGDVDVLISIPKLKTHLLTLLTCALKNVYGMIPGESKAVFHGDYPSPRSIARFLVDVYAVFQPALSIVDAVEAMEGNGPSTGRPTHVGVLLASRDPVALDSCCARALGLEPDAVPLIRYAAEQNLGVANLDVIRIEGGGEALLEQARMQLPLGRHLQHLPEWAFRFLTLLMTHRPEIQQTLCVRCGLCAETCSQDAITKHKDGHYHINRTACILCMCCLESCPHDAITVQSPIVRLSRMRHAVRRFIHHALHGD